MALIPREHIPVLLNRVFTPGTKLMHARLQLEMVHRVAESFPDGDWQKIETRIFVADRGEQIHSNWQAAAEVDEMGGVYAILLPAAWFSRPRTIHLHGPHKQKGEPIPFEFTVPSLTDGGYGVVYVGRTSNLLQRWQGHLSRGERKDGGQVKFGLVDCGLCSDRDTALRALRTHAQILYVVMPGPANCANRDLLEMSLCARFAPPFNIKSER
jgi:hypothetical protein